MSQFLSSVAILEQQSDNTQLHYVIIVIFFHIFKLYCFELSPLLLHIQIVQVH